MERSAKSQTQQTPQVGGEGVGARSQDSRLAGLAPQGTAAPLAQAQPQAKSALRKGQRHPDDALDSTSQATDTVTDTTTDSWTLAQAAPEAPASQNDSQNNAAAAGAPGASSSSAPLDPNALVEQAPPSAGAAAASGGFFSGLSTGTLVAGGAVVVGAAAAAGGGGKKDSTPADTQAPAAPALALKADTGSSATDSLTNNGALAPTGVEAGALLQYSVDGGKTWSNSFKAAEGANSVIARQVDAAGNVSASSAPLVFTLDTGIATPLATASSGTVQGGSGANPVAVSITDISKLSFAPAADGVARTYLVDSQPERSTYTPPANSGTHIIQITDTDAAGNTAKQTFNVTIDTTPPAAPTLALSSDTGNSGSDKLTNQGALTPAGVESGAKVEYSIDGGKTWSTTFTAAEGANSVTARQTDLAGNVSSSSPALAFTLDTTAPAAPKVSLSSDTGASGTDGITQNGTVSATGTEPGAKLEYSADGGKTWSASFTAVEGANSVIARQTDAAGNVSANSSALSFTKDTAAPAAPKLALGTDTGASSTDGITQNGAVSATATEAGAKLEYSADGGKTWSATFTAAEGANSVVARQTDVAGNFSTSSAALSFTKDTSAPAVPSLTLKTDTGSSATDGISQISDITTAGAEAGAKVEYSVDGGKTWSATFTAVEGANSVVARQTDVAGNVSSSSAALAFTKDTSKPNAPGLQLNVDTGSSSTDHISSKGLLTATGVEANGKVEFSQDGGATWGSTQPVADGSYTLIARVTDAAGNVSASSAPFAFTQDSKAPAAPTLSLSTDTGASSTDGITQNGAVSTAGTEAGAKVEFSVDGGKSWSASFTASEGANSVIARQTDVAGNISTSSAALAFTKDSAAPTGFAVTLDGDARINRAEQLAQGYTVSGLEANATATVRFTDSLGQVVTSVATNGKGTANLSSLADGSITVSVSATDLAGNVGQGTGQSATLDGITTPTLALSTDSFGAGTAGTATDRLTNNAAITVSAAPADLKTRTYTVDGKDDATYIAPTTFGQHKVSVTDTDLSGNTATSAELVFTLDTVAPTRPTLSLSADTGSSATDFITQKASVLAAGAEAAAAYEYSADNGTTWAATFTAKEGVQTVLVRAVDAAGNVSANASISFTNDNTAPTAPSVRLSNDTFGAGTTGTGTDSLTKDAALTISPPGADVATRKYALDGGADSLSYTAPTTPGTHTVFVTDTDLAGNSVKTSFSFTLDNTAPAAPSLTLKTDTGSSTTDGISQAGEINSAGAEAGAKVEYSVDGGKTWSATFTAVEGANSVIARQTDVAGNVSSSSAALVFTKDSTAPVAPSLQLNVDTGSSSTDHISSKGLLTATGAEANGKVEFSQDGGTTWGTTQPVADGSYTLIARVTDAAGNVSASSAPFAFTQDSKAPAAPTLSLSTDTGSSSTDGITQNGAVSATATEAGAKVEYSVDSGKTWSATFTAIEGVNSVMARQTDVAGNISTASAALSFTKDTSAPAAPSLTLKTDTGNSATDGISQAGEINTAGAEAGAKVEYSVDGGKTWSATFTASEGANSVVARQTDVAGNVSSSSAALVFTKDTIKPNTPTLKLSADTGTSATDLITQNASVLAAGVEAGGKLEYSADNGASWAPSITPKEGLQTVLARVTDVAGNTSTNGTLTFTNDNTAPTAPAVSLSNDTFGAGTTGTATDKLTKDAALTINAQGADVVSRSFVMDGKASTSYAAPTTAGAHTVVVTDTDAAGNSASTSFSFTLDNAAPAAPSLTLKTDTGSSATDGISQIGEINTAGAEAGAKVEYSVDGGKTWSATFTAIEGANSVIARQTDVAGNVSINPTALVFTKDTTAPTAPTVSLTNDTGTAGDKITNDPSLSLSALAAGGQRSYTVDGTTSASYTAPSSAGSHTVVVTDTDAAGNSASSAPFTFTLDTSRPATLVLSLQADTGAANVDGVTNNFALNAANAVAGGKVEYSTDNGNTWSSTFAPKEGLVSVIARQTNALGNVSANSAPLSFTYDKSAPTALAISLATDSGSSATDGITNSIGLSHANLEAKSTIEYSVDGGAWANSLSVAEGTHTIQARQTDLAGNTSLASNTLTLTKDTTAPTGFAVKINGGDALVNHAEQGAVGYTVTGLEAGVSVVVVFTDHTGTVATSSANLTGGTATGSASLSQLADGDIVVSVKATDAAGNTGNGTSQTVNLNGITTPTLALSTDSFGAGTAGTNADLITNSAAITFSAAPADIKTRTFTVDGVKGSTYVAPTTQGLHSVSVTDEDTAGNIATSSTLSFTLDSQVAAVQPSLLVDSGNSSTDKLTNQPALTTSNVEAGALVQYSLDNGLTWFSDGAINPPDGAVNVLARQTDKAGNVSASTALSFTKDTTAPSGFAVQIDGDTTITNSEAGNLFFSITGLEANASATVFFTDSLGQRASAVTRIGTGSVDVRGLADGPITVSVQATDAAGNTGAGTTQKVTLDTLQTPIAALVVDSFGANTSGTAFDGVTNSGALTLSAAPADLFSRQYFVDNGPGSSTYAPNLLADGPHYVIVRDTDKAGNVADSAPVFFTLDKTVATPTLQLLLDSGSNVDKVTNYGAITASDLEPGARLEYNVNGQGWTSTAPTLDGSYSVVGRQVDQAGNVSGTSAALNFTLDTTIHKPTLILSTNKVDSNNVNNLAYTVSGLDADATAYIEFKDARGVTQNASGGTAYLGSLQNGLITATVVAYDAAGNQVRGDAQTLTLDTFGYESLAVSGSTIVLSFSKPLDTTHLPNAADFTVRQNYGNDVVTVIGVQASGQQMTLILAEPVRSGSLSVNYNEGLYNGLDDQFIQSSTGTYLGFFYATTTVPLVVQPTVTKVEANNGLDVDAALAGDRISVQVEFSTPVSFGFGNARPTLTLTIKAPDGTLHDVTATYQGYNGEQSSDTHNSLYFSYTVQPSDEGSWSVKQINLNGAEILESANKSVSANLDLSAAIPAFIANGYLYGSNLVSIDAAGKATGTAHNELFFWADASTATATLTGVTGGAGDRDEMVRPIFLSNVGTAAVADAYTLDFDNATKSVLVFDNNGVKVQTVAVPQGSAWPTGIEALYFQVVYRDATTGKLVEAQNGDLGISLSKDVLYWQDTSRPTDFFVGGSYNNDVIDVSSTLALTAGGSHAVTSADRIVIRGERGNDTITGHSGVDIVYGNQGSNTINTGAGHDVLHLNSTSGGTNVFDGGTGQDSLSLLLQGNQAQGTFNADGSISLASKQIDWVNGTQTTTATYTEQYKLSADEATGKLVVTTRGGGTTTASNIEDLVLRFDHSDTINTVAMQTGTSGQDKLTANSDSNVLFGLGGDDVLTGASNGDVLIGGTGNDTLVFNGLQGAALVGGEGNDQAVVRVNTYLQDWYIDNTATNEWTIYALQSGANNSSTAGTTAPAQFMLYKQADGSFTLDTMQAVLNTGATVNNNPVVNSSTLSGMESLQFTDTSGHVLLSVPLAAPSLLDTAGPVLTVNGNQITLSFDQAIDTAHLPDPRGFLITSADGSQREKVASVSAKGNDLVLTLDTPAPAGTLTINYADPSRADDSKALQLASGQDWPSFTASTFVALTTAAIEEIKTFDERTLGAYGGDGDQLSFYVDFTSNITIDPASNGAAPTLAVRITAPDGSSHVAQAVVNSQPFINGGGYTDTIEFVLNLADKDVGTFAVEGIQLNGATITNATADGSTGTAADLSLANALLPNGSNIALGYHVSTTPTAAGAGTAANDLLLYISDDANLPASVKTGVFTGVDAGAGNRDVLAVQIVLPSSVSTYTQAADYELRYNSAAGQVEVWQLGGKAAVASYTVPTAANWPAGVEIVGYLPVFREPSGNIGYTEAATLTFSRSTLVYQNAAATGFTVQGSTGGDTIDVSSSVTPTGGSQHNLVSSDQMLILGNQGNDTITGHSGSDLINAGVGNNRVSAGGGDDLVILDGGSDTIDGGTGTDTVMLNILGSGFEDIVDADGTLHLVGANYDWNGRSETITLLDTQFTIAVNEASKVLTITDHLHGNAVSTVSNVEAIALMGGNGEYLVDEAAIVMGGSAADNLSSTAHSALLFGLAGNDTLAAPIEGGFLDGGSGDDTLLFRFDAGVTLAGGVGQDTAIMTIGADLGPLSLSHDSGTLVWNIKDAQDHTVMRLSSDGTHPQFHLITNGAAEMGYGLVDHWSDSGTLASVETLRIQNSVGTSLLSLTLDDVNKSVITA